MKIFHPLIFEKVGLNMFGKAVAHVKAIVLEVGQNTGTTSVLVMNRFKSRPVMTWDASDERLKNWELLTSTHDEIEKSLEKADKTQGSSDHDMRESTEKRTRGTADYDDQGEVTSTDTDGEEGAVAGKKKKMKDKKEKNKINDE